MTEKKWHILYCDRQIPACPITDFIEGCPARHQVKIFRFLNLLEEMGPTLPRPYADLLHDGIHELRLKLSGEQVRLLYFFCYEQYIILYHALVKNENRVSEKLIKETMEFRRHFLDHTSKKKLEMMTDAGIQKVS